MTKIWYFIKKTSKKNKSSPYMGQMGLSGSLKVFISNEKSKNKKVN